MVMGPTCGMLLGDLGAEVIKVEPIDGDNTRRLLGSGAGFFPTFNRNKKSIALDLKQPAGVEAALKLIATADIVSENFKPGTMQKLGLDYATLKKLNPRLIYVSHKGFLPGPYDHRTALDEVVQMMGGLAYMTGRIGDPLRAGTSVNDIMGGMFGAIGAMAALRQRELTGEGCEVQSALFENNIFLVAQHMMQFAATGQAADPMPSRISAWGVYDVFTVKDGAQIFLAAVSDKQWGIFCQAFALGDLLADPRLATNNDRVRARAWMMPILRERLAAYSAAAVWAPRRSRSSGIIQSRARTRSLLVASRGSASRSAQPRAWQHTLHCLSLTTARKICSPPCTVNTSYTPQAEMRLGIGSAAWPVAANCIMCWATRKTLFSNSAACTSQPWPVLSRWRSAAMAPMAPNMPPMMSFTLVPARSGSPMRPVM